MTPEGSGQARANRPSDKSPQATDWPDTGQRVPGTARQLCGIELSMLLAEEVPTSNVMYVVLRTEPKTFLFK